MASMSLAIIWNPQNNREYNDISTEILKEFLQKGKKLGSFKYWNKKFNLATHHLFPLQTMENVHVNLKAEFGP